MGRELTILLILLFMGGWVVGMLSCNEQNPVTPRGGHYFVGQQTPATPTTTPFPTATNTPIVIFSTPTMTPLMM